MKLPYLLSFKNTYWYRKVTCLRLWYKCWEINRLRFLPRYRSASTKLLGKPLRLVDAASFLSAYDAIFEREIYRFPSSREDPRILDCGANIGLGTLYWKQLYPAARVTAFEPDPVVFQTLVRNCSQWNLTQVELINKAVWNSAGSMSFRVEGADGGHLLPELPSRHQSLITVETVRLRDYLQDPVSLLKLDIEGAEVEVLLDCAGSLDQVENLFVEYHSLVDREQQIDNILAVLRHAGFRIHIQPELISPTPFIKHLNDSGMDQRLNIFAYRDHS